MEIMKQRVKKSNRGKTNQPKQRVTTKTIGKKQKLHLVRESMPEYRVKFQVRTNKKLDESWDFRKSNTKEYTHCFHPYPAMMIPQVARRIIDNFGKKAHVLFDPYCGTGTSLVEANLKGIDAIGTDLNPLARLIATTKTTRIDLQVLDLFLYDFMNYVFSLSFQVDKIHSVVIPQIRNIDFWFSKEAQQKLAVLLHYIENINNTAIKNFLKVAYSETVRESSFVKQGEFKLVRTKAFNEKKEPDVFGTIISKLSRNKQGLIEFLRACRNNSKTQVCGFNSVEGIPSDVLQQESVDLVVTSPPYGDSRTTVAYGQYSRLANEWLGYQEANQIDKILMGGERRKHDHIFGSEVLNDVIQTIQRKDRERARDVISFYDDYQRSIHNVSVALKKGGLACYVVGNRTVKGLNIPNDEITSQLFEENGFTHIETIVRNIPNKRMPLRNSPSNIVGETASTMRNEYIVVCQKNIS